MRYLLTTIFIFIFSLSGRTVEPIPQLKALSPFIGTWTSQSGSVDGSSSFTDVSKWEWAFGGTALRITHSVNSGNYVGESMIIWDAHDQQIIYRYVNNAGFYTDGVITERSATSILVHEFIRGMTEEGATETRAGYSLKNGDLYSWTQFKTHDIWGEKSEVVYKKTPNAEPVMPN